MKKIVILLALISFAFWACSENTGITTPDSSKTERVLKFKANSISQLMKTTVSKSIDGEKGGTIEIDFESADGEIKVKGEIIFPKDSFDGTEDISVSMAGDYAALDFGPSMTFEKSVELNLSLEGVEVNTDDNVSFQFIENGGDLSPIEYGSITVDVDDEKVIVDDAKINHFSRYGFTR
ncbi:MAG: hypothetical protein L3J41_09000 [Melioribacteraceae bacterium]|nr:hypothetical protein [Melioribacteraceae bacterium]